ncbi:MGMT family protein [Kineobactrum salinum]|uniref:MGMT family protein n=1 Tax=Kineobactrum salinum TaxID=2708301 RepID=UPI001E3126BD|nr:MGMT family protein [Kineobactrum salinum]
MAPTSEINQHIWQVVSQIPPGRVATYGDIARQAGLGRGARRVGAALRGLPGKTRIPWHRVVNAGGAISLPAGSDGRYRQIMRLRAEGIEVSDSGRISLARYRWDPGITEPAAL